MKTIRDHISGHDIAIDYHQLTATAIMCANGILLTQTIPRGSASLAHVAFIKGDLNSFGSFFDE